MKKRKKIGAFILSLCMLCTLMTVGASATLIGNGSRGAEVTKLQYNLTGIGYYCLPADGIAGSKTVQAIRNAQNYFGITADGIAGDITLGKIDALVREIQTDLQRCGYSVGVDGYYGTATRNAVTDFQRKHGLTADGQAGVNTRTALANNGSSGGSQTIANGTYTISPRCAQSSAIDCSAAKTSAGTNVQLYANNGENNQKLYVTYLGNGYYKLVFVHSGMALDVNGGSGNSGVNVQQWDWNDSPAQHWQIKDAGGGYYYIVNQCGGKYLDVCGGGSANETNIWVYDGNDSAAQKWKFSTGAASTGGSSNFAGTVYSIAHNQLGHTYVDYGGDTNSSWCGYYARYVLNAAYTQYGYSRDQFPYNDSTSATRLANAYQSGQYGTYYSYGDWQYNGYSASANANNGTYTPRAGDFALIDTNYKQNDGPDHIAIIIAVNSDGSFVTSEGNTGSGTPSTRKVKEHTYVKSGNSWVRQNTSCKVMGICSVFQP